MSKTSQYIADLCGVSRGTVDRALNDRPGINPATKEKILQVAEQIGYRPHFLAQSLVKGTTNSIGAVMFDMNNRLFPQLIGAMEARASELGYFLYVTITNKDQEKEKDCLRNLTDRRVDGMIVLSVNHGEQYEQFIRKLDIPFVTIGNFVSPSIPHVWIDDRQAIKDAVRFLVDRGYEEIIYVSPPMSLKGKTNLYAVEQRFIGFQEEAARYKDLRTHAILHKNYVNEIDWKLTHSKGKQAILCTSDKYALNVMIHLKRQGVRIPQDVGLMGFDHIDTLEYISPSLTTISYSSDEVGARAVDCLIAQITGERVTPLTMIGHRIVEGEST